MTYTDIAKMMEQMHLPFAYHHFERGKAPPPIITPIKKS